MFFGEYEYKVDKKGRVPLPPKFRQELREGLVLARSPEKCIQVYTLTEWKRLADTLGNSKVASTKVRKLYRSFFASAFDMTLDGQGRVAIPISLREHTGIRDTAVVIGANNYIEIWDKAAWSSEKASADEQMGQIIESLEVK